jgi:predicted enzyme related to lactoylglutathione lyase
VVDAHGHFAWYELITTDVAAARDFYTKLMGWGAQDLSGPGGAYVLLTVGPTPVCALVALPEGERDTGAKPCWIGYVGVDDVDAAADRVRRLGGTVYIPPTLIPGISRFSVFGDPQTTTLGLVKPESPGPAQPAERSEGRVGWHELLAADGETAMAFYGALFGWRKADADVDATGTYQVFSAGGRAIGGMLTKPAVVPVPFWLYYFNVGDIDAATKRVTAGGGGIIYGPAELPGGTWIVQCTDPQGAMFALEGRRRTAIGYFESVAARGPPDARDRRWHW